MRPFSFFRFGDRDKRKGQGLVEYALILVLVSIVVIAILTLFGDAVANSYCSVIYALNQGQNPPKVCHSPMLTCSVQQASANNFSLEAKVIDPDASPTGGVAGNYNGEISIQFYVNDQPRLRGASSDLAAEITYHYCFPGGNSADCDDVTTGQVVRGDVVKAIATDKDGHTGTCSSIVQ
jgi:pilus assembly protein Flp/PilA